MNYQLEIQHLVKDLNNLKDKINKNNFQIQEFKDLLEVSEDNFQKAKEEFQVQNRQSNSYYLNRYSNLGKQKKEENLKSAENDLKLKREFYYENKYGIEKLTNENMILNEKILNLEKLIAKARVDSKKEFDYLEDHKPQLSLHSISIPLNFQMTEAKLHGYIPTSEFINLLEKKEGKEAVLKFTKLEPNSLDLYEQEKFVVLTPDKFKYDQNKKGFYFPSEIEYKHLAETFNNKVTLPLMPFI